MVNIVFAIWDFKFQGSSFYGIFLCMSPEISFGRNGKKNMAENPFARSEPGSVASSPEGSESPITAARGCCKQPTGFFRQIFLVVEPKTDFSEKFQYGVNCSVFATLHLTLSALCFTVKKRKKSCRNFIFSSAELCRRFNFEFCKYMSLSGGW